MTRVILVVHALAGFAVLALAIHLLLAAWSSGPGASPRRHRPRIFASVLLRVTVVAFVTGAVIYPEFRVEVRGPVFDVHYPILTALFEVKERAGALLVVLAWTAWMHFRRADIAVDGTVWRGHLALVLILVLAAAHNVVSGLVMVMVKSV